MVRLEAKWDYLSGKISHQGLLVHIHTSLKGLHQGLFWFSRNQTVLMEIHPIWENRGTQLAYLDTLEKF